jgi:hypothetical protein
MKRKCTLVLAVVALGYSTASAQYTFTPSHTAAELMDELSGGGLTILNPVLTCKDSFSAIMSGTGGLDFDNAVILSTCRISKIFADYSAFPPGDDHVYDMYAPTTSNDRPINDLIDSYGYEYAEAYNTCSIDFDMVPQAKTLQMDFIFAATKEIVSMSYCNPFTDYVSVLISGGIEFVDTINLATFPGTDVPVDSWTLTADEEALELVAGSPGFCEDVMGAELMPFDEYYIDNYSGIYTNSVRYELLSTEIPIIANVSPCDTYHIKIAVSDGRIASGPGAGYSSASSSFFLKSGSLRTMGQPEECPTTVDPEPPVGLDEYLKQQADIKVSPNPFYSGMAIAIENDNGKELYSVALYDIGGRLLSQSKGNLKEVNASLTAIGNDLATGMYLLKIKSASGKYNHTVKVVKE